MILAFHDKHLEQKITKFEDPLYNVQYWCCCLCIFHICYNNFQWVCVKVWVLFGIGYKNRFYDEMSEFRTPQPNLKSYLVNACSQLQVLVDHNFFEQNQGVWLTVVYRITASVALEVVEFWFIPRPGFLKVALLIHAISRLSILSPIASKLPHIKKTSIHFEMHMGNFLMWWNFSLIFIYTIFHP